MTEDATVQQTVKTVGDALHYCAGQLEASDVFFGHGTDNPWDEAVHLVLSVAGLPPSSDEEVVHYVLDDAVVERVQALLQRRINAHIPLPYLLGRAWFAGLEFHCDDRAIIPRSPIAELIQREFQPWYQGPQPQRMLDLCCGGGCIGLAAAHYFQELVVDLVDVDENALALAAENSVLLGLEDRASIIHSNLFENIGRRQYDLILSNPPYVNESDLSSMPTEFHHEPELALGSGSDGLLLTRKILVQAGDFLSDTGLLIVEVGNSWVDLERIFPKVPFTWLEFERGGHGVFAISAKELQEYSASFAGEAL